MEKNLYAPYRKGGRLGSLLGIAGQLLLHPGKSHMAMQRFSNVP